VPQSTGGVVALLGLLLTVLVLLGGLAAVGLALLT
jgi:hypothetical protein